MADSFLHLARNGEPLGRWPVGEIRELLRAGFLREDDHYWTPSMKEWELLSDWPYLDRDSPDAWRAEAKGAVADAASFLARGTERLAQSARRLADQGSADTKIAATKLLEDYLPKIKDLAAEQIRSKPFLAAQHAIQDDSLMRSTFLAIYDLIPGPIKRFIKEDRFIDFCFTRRDELMKEAAEGIQPHAVTEGWPPNYRLTHVRLLVADFDRMAAWYRDQLGLHVRFLDAGVYAEFDAGPAILALFHRDFMAEALELAAPHELAPTLSKPVLILSVPQVDTVYLALKERGVLFSALPTDRPQWGVRTAHLTDPEANLIEINSPIHSTRP